MKKLLLLLPLLSSSLFSQVSEFKTREISVMAGLAHERQCKHGQRSQVAEVEIDEIESRPLGLFAGVTTVGDVATIRKDQKDGKTFASLSFCVPSASKVSGVIIPTIQTNSNANCLVDEIQFMDVVLTLTDEHGVDSDFMKAFRPIDFEESALCEKKRKGPEISDADPTIAPSAKDKESEYNVKQLKVEQN